MTFLPMIRAITLTCLMLACIALVGAFVLFSFWVHWIMGVWALVVCVGLVGAVINMLVEDPATARRRERETRS